MRKQVPPSIDSFNHLNMISIHDLFNHLKKFYVTRIFTVQIWKVNNVTPFIQITYWWSIIYLNSSNGYKKMDFKGNQDTVLWNEQPTLKGHFRQETNDKYPLFRRWNLTSNSCNILYKKSIRATNPTCLSHGILLLTLGVQYIWLIQWK